MKRNGFLLSLLIFFTLLSYSKQRFFFEKKGLDVFACDTIFNERYKDGRMITTLYQNAKGIPMMIKGKKYFEYFISDAIDGASMMLSVDNDRIHLVAKDALLKTNDYRDEVLVDFNSRPGDTWKIIQGGLLGNSIVTLDSIDSSRETYFLSMRPNIEVNDVMYSKRIVLSRTRGVTDIIVYFLGNSIHCQCQSGQQNGRQ